MNILEFAINMEKEGESFYRIQAKDNKSNGLFTVFSALADEEQKHGQILSVFLKDKKIELPDGDLPDSAGIFDEKFKSDIKQKQEQLDAYRDALKIEKDSIDLYRSMIENTETIKEKDMFTFIVKQEESHFSTIENIIYHLEKAESWVESAEFGVREDY